MILRSFLEDQHSLCRFEGLLIRHFNGEIEGLVRKFDDHALVGGGCFDCRRTGNRDCRVRGGFRVLTDSR